MTNRIIIHDPQWSYYRVKLTQTVGTLTVEGWIRHVWAHDRKEAAAKALIFYLRRNPGTEPRLVSVELEDYSRPIQI